MNRQLFVFVLALGLLTTGLATTGFAQAKVPSRTEAYYHFSKARMLDDGGKAAQAIEEYKKALAENNEYTPAAQALGRIRGYLN